MNPVLPTAAEPCAEGGCDRDAAAGDRRCALHAQRLGPLPAMPALPAAPVAAAPPPAPNDRLWRRLSGGLTGTALFTLAAMTFAEGDLSGLEHLVGLGLITSVLGAPPIGLVALLSSRKAGQSVRGWLVLLASLVPLALSVAMALQPRRVLFEQSSSALQGFSPPSGGH